MYQLSPYLQVISDDQSDKTMLYHALYGNPRVVNQEGLRFLELFQRPTAVEEIIAACDGDPSGIIREFAEICFLIEPGFDEKQYLRERKAQHLEKVAATQTIDRMGLAISDNCNFGCTHCLHFQPMNGQVLPIYQQPKNQLNI